MNYIIIENDPISRACLISMAQRMRPQWHLVFESGSVADTVHWMQSAHLPFHLMITDIELDDGDCFAIFDSVQVECPIIFTTAFDDYVLRTFEQHNIDYLLKPIAEAALEQAFQKYERVMQQADRAVFEQLALLRDSLSPSPKYIQRLLLSIGDNIRPVDIADVAYFVSEDKAVVAISKEGKRMLTSFKSLNELENMLDPHRFFRLSRDVITTAVAIEKISKYFKGRLQVLLRAQAQSETALVSAERRDTFLEWLRGYSVNS